MRMTYSTPLGEAGIALAQARARLARRRGARAAACMAHVAGSAIFPLSVDMRQSVAPFRF